MVDASLRALRVLNNLGDGHADPCRDLGDDLLLRCSPSSFSSSL